MTIALLSQLFAERDALEARIGAINSQIKPAAKRFWLERGIAMQPREEALRRALNEADMTPLEYAISHDGKCF